MKYLTFRNTAFVSAGIVALLVAYVAHTVLGMPRYAIRIDALGMAACLMAFIATDLFMKWRSK